MDASDWDERYREAGLLWNAGPNQWVEQYTAHLGPGHALDVAAGEGRNAVWLAERGWRVTAVDFSAVATRKGRELAAARGGDAAALIDWEIADVVSYSADRRYDLVLVIYLHLSEQQRRSAFQHAAAALAPGGTLLVVGHHADNLTDGVGGPPDPTVLYDEHDIRADLEPCEDLTVEHAGRHERIVAEAPRPALDVILLARRASA